MAERPKDVVIIGGGPAGLTAGIYLRRARIDALLLDKETAGGQALLSPLIENFPGFPSGIEGAELMLRMKDQAERFGLEIKEFSQVQSITTDGGINTVRAEENEFKGRSLIICSGRTPKKLGIPGEEDFIGKGVSYCATCDAPLFKGRDVLVVGGGDAAIEESLHLSEFASRVIVVHRRSELRASEYLKERAFSNPKLEFMFNSRLIKLKGDKVLSAAVVEDAESGRKQEIPASGVFLYVGNVPNTTFLPDEIELDENGYVKTDVSLQTSVSGIFAAGDVRSSSKKQVVCACAEGAVAAMNVQRYLESVGARKAYEGGPP